MKKLNLLVFFALHAFFLNGQNYKFINGSWFNGTSFESVTWFSVGGNLTKIQPVKIDSVIDLKNGFVVPPYGEAHNHNVMPGSGFKQLSNEYLKSGIFYVKNPCSLNNAKDDLQRANLIGVATSIDASFANGGITATNGHPFRFFEPNSPRGEGNFYHFVNTVDEFTTKWPGMLKQKPDFIKVFLLYSEEFDKRNDNAIYDGYRGVDPGLLRQIVDSAHQAGLRVSAHIETSADFHIAAKSGVDEMAHMPGFRGDPMKGASIPENGFETFLISEVDAQLAAKNGTVVVTTVGDVQFLPFYLFKVKRMAAELHRKNLATLKKYHVRIALGSDSYERNSLIEISYLKELNMFSNLEMLKMLSETTPETIFPNRKIAKLTEGYEASFLVLAADPLRDINHVKRIRARVKQGVCLR